MYTIVNTILLCQSQTSHGREANITSSAMKRRSLIFQLNRIIRFVTLNKNIKNVMEIIATDSNKVGIMSGN